MLNWVDTSTTIPPHLERLLDTEQDVPPDGGAELLRFHSAYNGVIRCLRNLDATWQGQIDVCESCINGEGAQAITEALELANHWGDYQEAISEAKHYINELRDAVITKPKAGVSVPSEDDYWGWFGRFVAGP